MSWRELLKNNISDIHDNTDKSDKTPVKDNKVTPFVTSVISVIGGKKLKKSCWTCLHFSMYEFPGLCDFLPEQKLIPVSIVDRGCKQYEPNLSTPSEQVSALWDHANKMADFTEDMDVPFKKREALVPAICSIAQIMDEINNKVSSQEH